MSFKDVRSIDCFFLATKHEPCVPLVPSRRASPPFGQYSLRLPTEGWPGWVDLGGSWDWDKFPLLRVEPDTVTHPSTNRVRRRATSLIWPTTNYAKQPRILYRRLPISKYRQRFWTIWVWIFHYHNSGVMQFLSAHSVAWARWTYRS